MYIRIYIYTDGRYHCPGRQVTKPVQNERDKVQEAGIPKEDEAFISRKDHKDSFPSRVECRLINPAKNNIGVISKSILDKINAAVRKVTNSNQWLNISSAIDWFNSITNKSNCTFFKFDIVSFYPSIKKKLLTNAINWARSFINISVQEVNVIMHSRKMCLFFEDECWVKSNDPSLDVSMGSLDSAEVCELDCSCSHTWRTSSLRTRWGSTETIASPWSISQGRRWRG